MEKQGQCIICSAKTSLKCSKCMNFYYCSLEHQEQHWDDRAHKHNCCPVKPKAIAANGFQDELIATTNIKQGDLIFVDQSIIAFPIPKKTNRLNEALKVCLSCCEVTEKFCSKCKWPICNTKCEQEMIHSTMECRILAECDVHFPEYSVHWYKLTMLLRTLLLSELSPARWKLLLALPGLGSQELANTEMRVREREIEKAFRFLYRACKLENVYDRETVIKVMDILPKNIQIKDNCAFIESKYSRITKGCFSNMDFTVIKREPQEDSFLDSFPLRMYFATKDIGEGEPLSLQHKCLAENGNPFMGTLERHKLFQKYQTVRCECQLCRDPREFGSNISTVLCNCSPQAYFILKKECGKDLELGYNVANNPPSSEGDWVWQCNSCPKCPIILNQKEFQTILEKEKRETEQTAEKFKCNVKEWVHTLLTCKANAEKDPNSSGTECNGLLEKALSGLLEEYQKGQLSRSKILHDNHQLLCELNMVYTFGIFTILSLNRHKYAPDLITLWNDKAICLPNTSVGVVSSGLWRELNEELQNLAEELLDILNIFAAKLSHVCGVLHCLMAFAKFNLLVIEVKKHKNYKQFFNELIAWQTTKKKAEECFTKGGACRNITEQKRFYVCQQWLDKMDDAMKGLKNENDAMKLVQEITT